MNVALAGGIAHAGGSLHDSTQKQWQDLKDLVPSYLGELPKDQKPSSSALGLVGVGVGVALAVTNPVASVGRAGTAAMNVGTHLPNGGGDPNGITSFGADAPKAGTGAYQTPGIFQRALKASLGDENLPHLIAWMPLSDTGEAKDIIRRAVEQAVVQASGETLERKIQWDKSLLGIRSEQPVFVKPDCQGKSWDGKVFSSGVFYDRLCSGTISLQTTDIPGSANPPPSFLKSAGLVVGPVEIAFSADGVLPPRGNPDAVFSWWKRFSAALPDGYYYYSSKLKGLPVILSQGKELWFVSPDAQSPH